MPGEPLELDAPSGVRRVDDGEVVDTGDRRQLDVVARGLRRCDVVNGHPMRHVGVGVAVDDQLGHAERETAGGGGGVVTLGTLLGRPTQQADDGIVAGVIAPRPMEVGNRRLGHHGGEPAGLGRRPQRQLAARGVPERHHAPGVSGDGCSIERSDRRCDVGERRRPAAAVGTDPAVLDVPRQPAATGQIDRECVHQAEVVAVPPVAAMDDDGNGRGAGALAGGQPRLDPAARRGAVANRPPLLVAQAADSIGPLGSEQAHRARLPRRWPVGSRPYVEEDEEEKGAHAPLQGEPRQAPQHGPRLTTAVTGAPPPTRRDAVVDVLHGVDVPDPYRWLEDGDSPETQAWAAAQNERTRTALDALPDRAAWHERLVALLGAPVSMGVRVAGDRVFTMERAGGRPQQALVVRSAVDRDQAARVLVDPAGLSADATTAIDWYHPSLDGRLVAYGMSDGGDENSVLHVLDVTTGDVLPDRIADTRACSLGWLPDAKGFIYTRYPPGEEYDRKVYRHHLGDDPAVDELVWDALPEPEAWPEVAVSPDGTYVLVSVQRSWSRADVYLIDLGAGFTRTVIAGPEVQTVLDFDGDRLLGTTTLDAPRGRVVAVPLEDPGPERWTTLVPESDDVVDAVRSAGQTLYVQSTSRAVAYLRRYDRDGTPHGAIDLGEVSALAGFDADRDTGRTFVQVESFARPPSLSRVEAAELTSWDAAAALSVPITIRQTTYRSADGTEIGLFLIHRADISPGPDTPAILTGYGGFAIASTPAWSPSIAAWCERGGLFAVAGLRGGLEQGEAWHHAGRREHKQNVFDDFIAAADHLVAAGLTSRDRLALRGRSNGGLLVGAVLTQRPDIAKAVDCGVPLLDMVRYPQFLIARLWMSEYGDPDVADEFAWLWAYSPYHHVVEGTAYPAVLLSCAEGDTRVDANHARKFAAALQWASSAQDDHPILLRQESRAGHGVGKPLLKQADEAADQLAFSGWQLGLSRPS